MARKIFYAHRMEIEEAHDRAFIDFLINEGHSVDFGYADGITRTDFSSYDLFILGNPVNSSQDFANKKILKGLGCSVITMSAHTTEEDGLKLGAGRGGTSNAAARLTIGYRKVDKDYAGTLPGNITIATTSINGFSIPNALSLGAIEIAQHPTVTSHKTIVTGDFEGQRRMFYGYPDATKYNAAGWDLFRRCVGYAMGDFKSFALTSLGTATVTSHGLTVLNNGSLDSARFRRLGMVDLEFASQASKKVTFESETVDVLSGKIIARTNIKKEIAGVPLFDINENGLVKYLIKWNDSFYSYADGQFMKTDLIDPVTEAQIDQSGIAENIPEEKYSLFASDYQVVALMNKPKSNFTGYVLPSTKVESWAEAGSLFETEVSADVQMDVFDGIKVL